MWIPSRDQSPYASHHGFRLTAKSPERLRQTVLDALRDSQAKDVAYNNTVSVG